uniref:Macaca fascicularis brain cDNA, clone: QtrA-16824 n=1 Tax=Macaca fascicularis TaxID=9541 RepID=I7GET2_MACFA|nr:unnamed protein product [Macaca fascicularis]
MNGISALVKEVAESSFTPSTMGGQSKKVSPKRRGDPYQVPNLPAS